MHLGLKIRKSPNFCSECKKTRFFVKVPIICQSPDFWSKCKNSGFFVKVGFGLLGRKDQNILPNAKSVDF